jgi:hypothetical protein
VPSDSNTLGYLAQTFVTSSTASTITKVSAYISARDQDRLSSSLYNDSLTNTTVTAYVYSLDNNNYPDTVLATSAAKSYADINLGGFTTFDLTSDLDIPGLGTTSLAVVLKEVSLVPNKADTLAKFKDIKTSLSIWGFVTGDIQLGSLQAKEGFIHLIKTKDGSNYQAFLPKKSKDTISDATTNYAKLAYKLLNKVSNLVPTDLDIENFQFVFDDNGTISTLSTDKLVLDDEDLENENHDDEN